MINSNSLGYELRGKSSHLHFLFSFLGGNYCLLFLEYLRNFCYICMYRFYN